MKKNCGLLEFVTKYHPVGTQPDDRCTFVYDPTGEDRLIRCQLLIHEHKSQDDDGKLTFLCLVADICWW